MRNWGSSAMMWILINTTRPTGVEGAGRPGCGAGGTAGPGRTTSRRAEPHVSTPGPTGVEGAGGTGGTGESPDAGPGRGAGGRWQGQGGPRDRPLRAAGSRVAISRAGRRPPAHTAARPIKASHAAPATPVGPQATSQHHTRTQKRPPGTGWAYLSRLWESNPRPIHYE